MSALAMVFARKINIASGYLLIMYKLCRIHIRQLRNLMCGVHEYLNKSAYAIGCGKQIVYRWMYKFTMAVHGSRRPCVLYLCYTIFTENAVFNMSTWSLHIYTCVAVVHIQRALAVFRTNAHAHTFVRTRFPQYSLKCRGMKDSYISTHKSTRAQ